MAELRIVIDEILHGTSTHEPLEVAGIRMNQVQQNLWMSLVFK